MKKIIGLLLLFLCLPSLSIAAMQTFADGDVLSAVRTKILANDSELYGHRVTSGSITGDNLTLVLADASTIVVDVSTLLDNTDAQTVTAFSLNSTTNILTLTLSGGNTSTVDLSDLVSAGGATAINDLTDVDTTGKATGKVLKFDASGNLVVGDDEIGAAGTGDITGVTAGSGLTGGGDTGAVTLSLSTATSDAIAANTAKISFDSASSTRLANTSGTNTGNQVASGVPFTPFGTISAMNVQAAIQEVRDEASGGSTTIVQTVDITGVGESTVVPSEVAVGDALATKQNIADVIEATVGTGLTGAIAVGGENDGKYVIDIAATAVTPGAYTNSDITIGADGRITAAANGTGGSGIDSVITGFESGAGTVAATDTILEAIEKLDGNIEGVSVGSPLVSVPAYSDDTCTAGTYAIDHDNDLIYYCYATDTWDRVTATFADWSNPYVSIPAVSSATVTGSNGDVFTLTFSEAVSQGAGWNVANLTISCSTAPAQTVSYTSGDTSDTHIFSLAPGQIASDDTCVYSWPGTALGLVSATGGDLAEISTQPVNVTGSTYTSGASGETLYPANGNIADYDTYPTPALDDYLVLNDSDNGTYAFTTGDFKQLTPGFFTESCTAVSTVTVHVIASSSTGTPNFRFFAEGSPHTVDIPVSTTPTEYSHEFAINPNTTSAWTCGDVDDLTAGLGSRTIESVELRIHEIWVTYE